MDHIGRIRAAFTHTQPDRTPLFEYVLLSPIADRALGRAFYAYDEKPELWLDWAARIGYSRAVERYARERLEIANRLHHDMLYVVPSPLPGVSADPVPPPPDYPEPAERLQARNDIARAQLEAPMNQAPYEVYDALNRLMAQGGEALALFAPAYTLGIWSDVDLMMTMLTDPDIAREHFRLAADKAIRMIGLYGELGVPMIGVGGDFAGNRLLISPAAYREFVVPEVRRAADAAREAGAWAITASDGDVRAVLGDFLIESHADGYMEIDARAGMDMGMLKSAVGDRICLMGNMDCGELLSFASPAEIARQTHACLDAGWGNGGHVFTASNAISASVPFENYRAMSGAYHEHFGLTPVVWPD